MGEGMPKTRWTVSLNTATFYQKERQKKKKNAATKIAAPQNLD